MKFLAVLSAVLALNSFARAELPQCTLSQLPQCTLESPKCHCPNDWPCTCPPNECKCVEGKQNKVGVSPNYEDAVSSGKRHGCPLVAWIGLPAQPVAGAIAYHAPAVTDKRPRVWVGMGASVEELSASASVADVEAAVERVKQVRPVAGWHIPQPGEPTLPGNHWHVCHNCGYAVQHGRENNGNYAAHTCPCGMLHLNHDAPPTNLALAAPPMTYYQQPMRMGGNCPT